MWFKGNYVTVCEYWRTVLTFVVCNLFKFLPSWSVLDHYYSFRVILPFETIPIFLFWPNLKKNQFVFNPFTPDLTSNSPYCLPYNSWDVSWEILVLDQLMIPPTIKVSLNVYLLGLKITSLSNCRYYHW